MQTFRPLDNEIFAERYEDMTSQTKSGFLIAPTTDDTNIAKVINIGPKVEGDIKAHDKIYFTNSKPIQLNGKTYLIINESHAIGIIEEVKDEKTK